MGDIRYHKIYLASDSRVSGTPWNAAQFLVKILPYNVDNSQYDWFVYCEQFVIDTNISFANTSFLVTLDNANFNTGLNNYNSISLGQQNILLVSNTQTYNIPFTKDTLGIKVNDPNFFNNLQQITIRVLDANTGSLHSYNTVTPKYSLYLVVYGVKKSE